MGQMPDSSEAPLAVGLLALHDKKFFEALLTDPAKALRDLADSGRITCTPSDQELIKKLVAEANLHHWNPMDEWEKYKRTGIWQGGWPAGWVEMRRRP